MSTSNKFFLSDGTKVRVTWSNGPANEAEGKSLWESKGKSLVSASWEPGAYFGRDPRDFNKAGGGEGSYLGLVANDQDVLQLELDGIFAFNVYTGLIGTLRTRDARTFEVVFSIKASVAPKETPATLVDLSKRIEAKFVFSQVIADKGVGQDGDGSSAAQSDGTSRRSLKSLFTLGSGGQTTKPDPTVSGVQPDSSVQSGVQMTAPEITLDPPLDGDSSVQTFSAVACFGYR